MYLNFSYVRFVLGVASFMLCIDSVTISHAVIGAALISFDISSRDI